MKRNYLGFFFFLRYDNRIEPHCPNLLKIHTEIHVGNNIMTGIYPRWDRCGCG